MKMNGTDEMYLWQQSIGGRITRSVIADCFVSKRYGVDKSPLGAFKAARQITQVPQDPGSFRAFVDASEKDRFVKLL